MRPDHFLAQLSPENVLGKLQDAVIGQDEAKRSLVSAVWWNLYRSALIDAGYDPKLLPGKLNALLLGPSGIGKTELAKATASIFGVPWVTTSAPNYSSAGYTGADVDDMLGLLLQAADGDSTAAEHGVVVLDEVDKLRRRDFGGQSDVGCEAVQQAMLALLEGCEAMPRARGGERTKLRSHFVTFVGTGAFVGLDVAPGPVSADLLIGNGFIPEFVARWSLRIRLQDVDREMLRMIIRGKRSALNKLANLFQLHGIEFVADDKAVESLVEQALRDGVGARALNETLWTRLNSLVAEIPQMLQSGIRRVVIDPATMQGLPAWKIPGEEASLPSSASALLHPVKACERVDTNGWSDVELHQRLDFLLKKLGLEKAAGEVQNTFRTYLRAISGESKTAASVRLCEEMAFALAPPCSVEEFCAAFEQAECESREGVMHLVRYKRAVAKEQKFPRATRIARRRGTCPNCSATLAPRSTRCPACGAEAVP